MAFSLRSNHPYFLVHVALNRPLTSDERVSVGHSVDQYSRIPCQIHNVPTDEGERGVIITIMRAPNMLLCAFAMEKAVNRALGQQFAEFAVNVSRATVSNNNMVVTP